MIPNQNFLLLRGLINLIVSVEIRIFYEQVLRDSCFYYSAIFKTDFYKLITLSPCKLIRNNSKNLILVAKSIQVAKIAFEKLFM